MTPLGTEEQPKTPARRQALIAALGCVAAAFLVLTSWLLVRIRAGHRGPAHDIILVTIDTLRADSVGYAGNTRVKTPFLDSLAGRGMVFENAHAHNVITLASHTNILTGLYPYQHGVRENAGFKLDPKHETVAAMLHRGGYVSGAFVGAFPLDARFGLNRGFDVYDDNYGKGQTGVDFVVPERRAQVVLDSAIKWWNAHAGEKRFLWVHLYDPHAPYAPPEPFLSSFRDNEYLGEISYVDDALSKSIGPIVAADPNALIVITADHGEALGDHGEATHGLFAYESTLKIPLLVAGHGTEHRKVTEFVRHVDIVPTILEAAGLPKPAALPGASLFHQEGSRDSYFESLSASLNRGWAPLIGIIHGGLKYIDLPLAELYDLPRDPRELQNLREERRRDVETIRRLLAPMQALPSARAAVSSEEVARLRSLGYVSGNAAPRQNYTAADDPKNLIGLDSKMHAAVNAFERGNPGRALDLAREVVAARSDMEAGRELLAFMLQQNDRVDEAMEQLRILVSKPNAPDSDVVQLALLLSETGNPKAAVDLLAPRAGSNDPDLANALGVALSDSGREAEARSQFERVLALDANNAPALQNLGILALKHGDASMAEANLARALELNPKLPLALNTLGVIYAQKNNLDRAIESWKRAVALDPRQYDALLNIGIVEAKAGNTEEARDALERFIKTAPKLQYAADLAEAQRILAQLH